MSSEKRPQGVENCAKIVVANVENYESKIVDNDVPYEIPPLELRFVTKPT